MLEFEYETKVIDGKGVIAVTGDFDNEQAGEALRLAFNKLFDAGERTIVLDLAAVEIINSYGIGKILIHQKRLKTEGGELKVARLSGFVKEAFDALMLERLLPVDNQL